MKNYIFLLFLLLTCNGMTQSINYPEEGCPITIIKTDPNNYTNPNDPNQVRKWNWMEEPYYTYYRLEDGSPGIATLLINPFYDQSPSLNTVDFVNQDYKDFQPADGWELLYKKFGSPQQGITYPFFVLYNRYSGKIRVFVNITNSAEFTFNNCEIALSFDKDFINTNSELTQSAVLNNLGEHAFSPIELQRNASHYSYNQALDNGNQNGYQWMVADYNTAFDPCTCGLETKFYLRVRLKNHVKITGTIFGNYSTLLDSDSPSNQTDEIGGFWGSIQKFTAFGAGIINGLEGVLTSANKQYDNGEKLISEAQKFVKNADTVGVFTADQAANINSKIGEVLKLVPFVGSLFTLASTAISLINNTGNDFNNLTNAEKLEQGLSNTSIAVPNINLTIDAGLDYNSDRVLDGLKVPGSIGNFNVIHSNPVYDNILGVFNLLEQPEFEIITYQNKNDYILINNINSLKIKKTPKILLNPSSGLKIKNLEYAIVFENKQDIYFSTSVHQWVYNYLNNPFNPEKFSASSKVKSLIYFGTLYTPLISDKNKYFNSIGLNVLDKGIVNFQSTYEEYTQNFWQGIWGETTYHAYPFSEYNEYQGYKDALFQTDFLNQSCISKKTIFNFSDFNSPKLKVKLILEPIEKLSNSKVEEVVHILTFPGNVTTKNSFYTPNYDTILNEIKINFDDLSFNNQENINTFKNLTLKNETVKTSIRVLNSLVLDENVVFEANKNYVLESTGTIEVNKTFTLPNSSTLQLIAGREITINPEAIINPETVIMIDSTIICNCEKEKDIFPTNAEIAALCNSNKYYERSNGPLKQDEEGIDDENLSSKNDILLYPNPSENRTTIESQDEIIGLKIYDVSGKEFELNPLGTKYKINLDFSNLEHGLYLINIQTINQEVTKQFVKL
jgi:hypothetical protein